LIPKRDLDLVGGVRRSQNLMMLTNGGERVCKSEMNAEIEGYPLGKKGWAYKGPLKN
jgi:hypothetical protein